MDNYPPNLFRFSRDQNMTANQTTFVETDQALPPRITRSLKGKLILESSSCMCLDTLLKAFEQGQTNEALLNKYSNLKPEDVTAARLYARKLASNGKVESPQTQTSKIISLPVTNAQPPKPITNHPAKIGGVQNLHQVNVAPTTFTNPIKIPAVNKPTEKPPTTPEPPKSTPVQPSKPLQTDSFCYKDKLNLTERTTKFGVDILKLYNTLPQTTPAQLFGDQVLRSGASVGAHYREAMFARSQAEFVSKIQVGLQELEESKHWFQLLVEGGIVEASRLATLRQEANEITAILIATVNLTKTRPGEK